MIILVHRADIETESNIIMKKCINTYKKIEKNI